MTNIKIPNNLRYTREHEWAQIEGDLAIIGITDFAQSSLGDIVFVELPELGSTLHKDKTFGVVESVKSVSDLYAPLSGQVVERNEALLDSPELLNSNAYEGWLIKVKLSAPQEVEHLLNAGSYQELIERHA